MTFIILNLFLSLFFIFETVLADRIENRIDDGTNPAIANILILAVITCLYTLFLVVRPSVTPALFTLLMRICFLLEGCMLVNVMFCFIYYAWKYSSGITYTLKFFLYIVAGYFIFFQFKEIKITSDVGILVRSNYLFSGAARTYFPWTWYSLYRFIFEFMLPAIGCLVMLVRNEMKAQKLDRHRGYIYTLGLAATWLLTGGLYLISKIYPGYTILHYYMYVPLMIILPYGSWLQSAPSGRSLVSFFLKVVFLYIMPAAVLGAAFMLVYYLNETYGIMVAAIGLAVVFAACFLVNMIYKPLKNSKFFHSSDYQKI